MDTSRLHERCGELRAYRNKSRAYRAVAKIPPGEAMRDDLLRRYVRYLNCSEELRVIASDYKNASSRHDLLTAADQYEHMAASINAIIRARA